MNKYSIEREKPINKFKYALKIMRTTLFFLFFSIFLSQAGTGYSQEVELTLNLQSASIKEICTEIEKGSNFRFIFAGNARKTIDRQVDLTTNSQDINEILDNILSNTELTYRILDNQIVIYMDESKEIDQEIHQIGSELISQQQKKLISGNVEDESGEPIIGANIIEKGTTNGTVTDMEGNFSLNVENDAVLQISYIGYLTQEVSSTDQTSFHIILQEDTQALDELMVVGYGAVRKRDLTGAVSSIKMEDAPINTVSTVGHLLAGTAAGLEVNTLSAQPGGGISINVRGATSVGAGNDPLIVIDGFPVSSSNEPGSGNRYEGGPKDFILGSLNPNDIESIEVLKDASSTAIYGARAGHGVILITTKRGKAGIPLVKYSSTVSIQKMNDNYKLLNARDYMLVSNQYLREQFLINNGIAPYGNRSLSEFPSENIPFAYTQEQIDSPVHDTYWLDEITRTGFQHQHNLSLNGGSEATQYQASLSYFTQDGIIKENDMRRVSGRINLDQKISDNFKVGMSIMMNQNKFNNIPLGSGSNEYAGIIRSAVQFSPLLPIMDENGDYTISSSRPLIPNPVSLLEITDESIDERLLAVYYAEYNPIKDLLFRFNAGVDRKFRKRSTYIPKTTLYGKNAGGEATINQYDNRDYLMDITATYTKNITDHNFTILAGHSYQQFNAEGLNAGNRDFLTDSYLFNNIGAGDFSRPTVGSWRNKNTIASFFGRINYAYLDKYLLTLTLRSDGASNLAKGNQWGHFPSMAAAWHFSEESFMSSLNKVLTSGKLRLSYGETGNSNIGNGALDYYRPSARYIFNDVAQGGVQFGQVGNRSLTWETTKEYNLGLDIGLFRRVNITAELYSRQITDLLTRRNLMSYYILPTIADNIGTTQSNGFELTINSYNIDTQNFKWNTIFTFSQYKDRWKERADTWNPAAYEKHDDPIRAAFGYRTDGLIQEGEVVDYMPGAQPGQIKIKDINSFERDENGNVVYNEEGRPVLTGNSDGRIDEADREFLGSLDPDFRVGLANTFQYKNWNLNMNLYGSFNMLRGETYLDYGSMGGSYILADHNFPASMKDVWRADNPTGKYPGYTQVNNPYGTGDYFYRKISYVRVRNITLGYNIPLKTKILSNLHCYVDVNNPFLFTNYKGIDPETDYMGTHYVDVSYPNTRSITFGIDITF